MSVHYTGYCRPGSLRSRRRTPQARNTAERYEEAGAAQINKTMSNPDRP
ncbi:hypothetical protein JW935_02120 [candidate division KSB1 bacterium]|nr:hypothetical protein [candidate division KSB1 bacterium]